MISRRLSPQLKLLSEEYVLVQAWKKTVNYLRYHNWYADTLEIDCSAVDLQRFLKDLRNDLNNYESWQSDPIKFVPAPKSQQWSINLKSKKWEPMKIKQCNENVRPLAHVSLRDQVVATACVLCLADIVETKQGDTRANVSGSERKKVVSYGNRLFCDEFDGKLRHRWGSKYLYRNFFQDYKTFISRPEVVVSRYNIGNKRRLAIFSSDLYRFFDQVRPSLLADKVSVFCQSEESHSFLSFFRKLFDWQWAYRDRKDALEYAEKAVIKSYNHIALPQGLVASGFMSNIVLLDFDDALSSFCGKIVSKGVRILDVCRYVDDLRIVLEVPPGIDIDLLKDIVCKWLKSLLRSQASGLNLNDKPEKTNVEYIQSSEQCLFPQSQRMRRIGAGVSGGFDAIGGLGLLAEIQGLMKTQGCFGDSAAQARVQWPLVATTDVADDTVARFAANKFRSTFRSLRPLLQANSQRGVHCEYPLKESKSSLNAIISKHEVDAQARAFSRDLVERWINDPSNVRLLRVALDVYPDSAVLESILNMLWYYVGKSNLERGPRRVAMYCLGEIFRAGAIETGQVHDKDSLPADVDINKYRDILSNHAVALVRLANIASNKIPWFTLQQALLFLAVFNPKATPNGARLIEPELRRYFKLITFLCNKLPGDDRSITINSVLALRSYGDVEKSLSFISNIATTERLKKLAETDKGCLEAVLRYKPSLKRMLDTNLLRSIGLHCGRAISIINDGEHLKYVPLTRHYNSPIKDECLLVDLAHKVLAKMQSYKNIKSITFSNCDLSIAYSDKKPIAILDVHLNKHFNDSNSTTYYYRNWPKFIRESGHWRWCLGEALLFAMRGSASPIPIDTFHRKKSGRAYSTTRSEWIHHYYGGYFGDERSRDRSIAVSTWFESFLIKLLAWPGCATRNVQASSFSSIRSALSYCLKRKQELEQDRGKGSNILYLREPVPSIHVKNRNLRLCIAQTVIPRPEDKSTSSPGDFNRMDLSFNDKGKRYLLKNHLSAVLAGVNQLLIVRDTHNSHVGNDNRLDLIVLPELAIHQEDIRTILLPFVRRHKCMVFGGLIYHHVPSQKKLVNESVWIIPTRTPLGGLQIKSVYQGKEYLAPEEKLKYGSKVAGYRPCQWLIEFRSPTKSSKPLVLSGSVCYDATDLKLVSELRDKSDIYLVSALNRDVSLFDTMAQALHYHMYQMVIVANNGTYGGSNAYAPYENSWERKIFHVYGQPQAHISFLEINDFNDLINRVSRIKTTLINWKTPPAGWCKKYKDSVFVKQ